MTRFAGLLTIAVLTMAAAPSRYPPLAMAEPLQLSPPPAASNNGHWTAFAPAPVPDLDLSIPAAPSPPARTELTPGIVHTEGHRIPGDGFTPYSTIQADQNRRSKPAPGLNLSVPLQ